ncbi:DUF3375 domain-containing protein [Novipirellula sp.]|uniref:DUF3375 domain-containing protein n=1 Tax=Novipirellula sp. TaxID=2795430 RepID=UPI0035660E31
MDREAIRSFLEFSPAIRLLKADQGAYVLFFLYQTFKGAGSAGAILLPQDELIHRLEIYQEQLWHEEHPVLSGSADRYLREWSDAGWLRRFLSPESSGRHYQLTRHAEDAIRFVDTALSRDTRLVGTEGRLRLVIDTLSDIARGASADPDRRLAELMAERDRIDAEIKAIESGVAVQTYHPAQIRERFHTAVDLLKTLQSDFRAVEDRFVEIARKVQRDAIDAERTRGQILAEALDAEDLVNQQDEGVSFNAFVTFLLSPQAQSQLRKTIGEVTRLEEIASERESIEHMRRMVPSLLAEADNVLRQTGRLSQTLRRLLDRQSSGHRKRTAEVLAEIRTLAAKMKQETQQSGQPVPTTIGLQIETSIEVTSPLARPFWTPPQVFDVVPETHVVDVASIERQARKLASLKRLEWDRMRDTIATATENQSSIRLSQLLGMRPPKAGVIELLGWLQIAHDDGHRIDRDAEEIIDVQTTDETTGRPQLTRVKMPLVTFLRTEEKKNESLRRTRPR